MLKKLDEKIVGDVREEMLSPGDFQGVCTGFIDYDGKVGGFENGELIVLGARPAMGKTTFALSLIENMCVMGDKTCIYFSGGVHMERVIERLIRLHGNMERNGADSVSDIRTIVKSAGHVSKARLWIDDSCIANPDEFMKRCRHIGKFEKVDIIIIDYLQVFLTAGKKHGREATASALEALKELAIELDCPVLVLSQLTRGVEYRKEHRPLITDFRYPEEIAENADTVLFLYREAYYDYEQPEHLAELIVAKHRRMDPRTIIELHYDSGVPKFRDADVVYFD